MGSYGVYKAMQLTQRENAIVVLRKEVLRLEKDNEDLRKQIRDLKEQFGVDK